MTRQIRFFGLLFCYVISLVLASAPVLAQQPQATTISAQGAAAGVVSRPAATTAGAPSLGEDFQEFVAEQMKTFDIPGMGLVVVRNNQVLLAKGYGYSDIERKLPVTTKTLFGIGSITKSFTVSLLGMLAGQGKLDWDHPVCDYMPTFRLKDPVANSHATARDLVTHRTGLPRHDALWYNSPLTREQILERLQYLQPNKDFRSTYQYNNLMLLAAGHLAETITGKRWEQLVRENIFEPLGMTDTNTSVLDLQTASDHAQTYGRVKDEFVAIPFRNIDALGPAGAINSNIDDMQKYLLMHMNGGRSEDRQILPAEQSKQMQTPQMVTPDPPAFPEEGFTSYGMAFFISAYRGHRVIFHTGHIDGFSALLSFMPQENIGMVMLINVDGERAFPVALERNIYDRLLGLDQLNWSQRLRDKADEARKKAAAEDAKREQEKADETRPSHDLSAYAGQYRNEGYGTLMIAQSGGSLRMTYNEMTAPLQHYRYDAFEVPKNDVPRAPFQSMRVQFNLGIDGDIAGVAVPLEREVAPIIFSRVKDSTQGGSAKPRLR